MAGAVRGAVVVAGADGALTSAALATGATVVTVGAVTTSGIWLTTVVARVAPLSLRMVERATTPSSTTHAPVRAMPTFMRPIEDHSRSIEGPATSL